MTRRTSLIQIRVTEDEKAAITKRAGSLTVGEYMRGLALGAVSGNPEAREGGNGPGRDAPAAKPPASPRASTPLLGRRCARCHVLITSPVLRIHPNCGGKIEPPPKGA